LIEAGDSAFAPHGWEVEKELSESSLWGGNHPAQNHASGAIECPATGVGKENRFAPGPNDKSRETNNNSIRVGRKDTPPAAPEGAGDLGPTPSGSDLPSSGEGRAEFFELPATGLAIGDRALNFPHRGKGLI
jgi:hypothetical protein